MAGFFQRLAARPRASASFRRGARMRFRNKRFGPRRRFALTRRRRFAARRRGGRMHIAGIGALRPVVDFKVCHVLNLAGDASVVTDEAVIALNDPTDFMVVPAGTVQPTGWEEWSAFYEHARVLNVTVSARFEKTSTTVDGLAVGLLINDDSTAAHTAIIWTNWCEFPRSKIRHISGMSAAGTIHNPSVWLRSSIKPYTFFNRDKKDETQEINMPDTSPTTRLYLHLLMGLDDQSVPTTNDKCLVRLTIKWRCQLYDRRNLVKGADT